MALSPAIFFLGIENIIRTQYMIPNHMDKQFTSCVLITAIINLMLSAVLIPAIGVYGAVIGTIIAEFVCSIIQMLLGRSIISIRKIVKVSVPYIISGLLMYYVIYLIKHEYNHSVWHLLLQVVLGGGIIVCLAEFIYCFFQI